jgi:hypothetical protein
MKYYLFWRIDPIQEEMEEKFHRKDEMLLAINKIVSGHPQAVFRAFYGYKLTLVPHEVITSYTVKREG